MTEIIKHKKEAPLTGLVGAGGGLTGFGLVGGRAGPTYDSPGQQAYTSSGTYTWVGGANTLSVSMVAVSGGGGAQSKLTCTTSLGGSGGGLRYKNDIAIVGGADYTIVVGSKGFTSTTNGSDGGESYVQDPDGNYLVRVSGGKGGGVSSVGGGDHGSNVGDGGGNGGSTGQGAGSHGRGGGGGAGGYSGDGGDAGSSDVAGSNGSGGGGGGGGGGRCDYTGQGYGGGGGGVGLEGEGSNGSGGASRACSSYGPNPRGYRGTSGSGGESGGGTCTESEGLDFGGGAGGQSAWISTNPAGSGGVRLIWPGDVRTFPSTRTADE